MAVDIQCEGGGGVALVALHRLNVISRTKSRYCIAVTQVKIC